MRVKHNIKELTSGVFASLTDLLLYTVYLTGASIGKTGSRGIYQAFSEADIELQNFNHHTLAMIWHQLTKKRLIRYQRRNNLYSPEITEYGMKKLKRSLPEYQLKRPWDGKIYLITYDISEIAHTKRDKMRRFLKNLCCKKLQDSVWLNPYNIRELLDEYVIQNNIPGTIIISDIGKDGGIGNTTIQYLLVKLYELERLNDRYAKFISETSDNTLPQNILIYKYLSILKDDPQLPFELLPNKFKGSEAFKKYKLLLNNYIISLKRPLK